MSTENAPMAATEADKRESAAWQRGYDYARDAYTPADTTPAPLDPSKVKAGDTVTVSSTTTSGAAYEIKGKVWEPNHSPGHLWVGPIALDALGVTLTDHQPAPKPEPEWALDTLADITVGGNQVRAIRQAFPDSDAGWVTIPGSAWWWDKDVTDVRPLVVIDPAEVDVAHLAHVYDDAPGTERTGIRAVLAALGIEVAR